MPQEVVNVDALVRLHILYVRLLQSTVELLLDVTHRRSETSSTSARDVINIVFNAGYAMPWLCPSEVE